MLTEFLPAPSTVAPQATTEEDGDEHPSNPHTRPSGNGGNLLVKLKADGEERVVVNAKDPSRTAVIKFTVDPLGEFPWHTHPGR
jgi:hypothetical protein